MTFVQEGAPVHFSLHYAHCITQKEVGQKGTVTKIEWNPGFTLVIRFLKDKRLEALTQMLFFKFSVNIIGFCVKSEVR